MADLSRPISSVVYSPLHSKPLGYSIEIALEVLDIDVRPSTGLEHNAKHRAVGKWLAVMLRLGE